MIYFDHAASTVPDKETILDISSLLENDFANSSSNNYLGKKMNNLLESARKTIADSFNIDANFLYFTNSATIAANIIIQGYCDFLTASSNGRNEIIISEIEHIVIHKVAEFLKTKGFIIHIVPVNKYGQIDSKNLSQLLNKKTALVAIMSVNNEIGTIQDIPTLTQIVKEFDKNIFFVCDFVQGMGKIPVNNLKLVDSWFIAGHKIGAPKGVACFYLNPDFIINPILFGGGQENGLFPGTTDYIMPFILSKIIKKNLENLEIYKNKCQLLREYFFNQLDINKINYSLTVPKEFSVPNVISINFENIKGQHIASILEQKDIIVSTKSACSSFCLEQSHVIRAIKLKRKQNISPIRISLSHINEEFEIDILIDVLLKELKQNVY